MVGHYWKKRFGIINGVITSGSAVFTLSMYFLLDFLMDEVGVSNIVIQLICNNILIEKAFWECLGNIFCINSNISLFIYLVSNVFSHIIWHDGDSNALRANVQTSPQYKNKNRN